MAVLLQINVTANWGSHGRIAENIGELAMEHGWGSHIAYGRYANKSKSEIYKIGSAIDIYNHVLQTRVFDRHGLASKQATRRLIEYIDSVAPDIYTPAQYTWILSKLSVAFRVSSKIRITSSLDFA